MMTTISSFLRRGRHALRNLTLDPGVHRVVRLGVYALAGFVLSAASLGNAPQPLALGLLLSSSGWPCLCIAAGGMGGYLLFWGQAGTQGAVWMGLGLFAALLVGDRPITRQTPLLLPALAGVLVAGTGMAFQFWQADDIPLVLYLLRLVLAGASTALFTAADQRQDPVFGWLIGAAAVLSLAQIAPVRYLNPGFLTAGAIAVSGAFPAAALAGLALDLSQVTPVPMTAVLCLVYFLRLIPRSSRWFTAISPGLTHVLVAVLSGTWDFTALPALALGGLLGVCLPGQPRTAPRRGETGVIQVRLELAAGVLTATEQLLSDAPEEPIDEDALIGRALERACGGCPARKGCRERESLFLMPEKILHRPLLTAGDLPLSCRKSGRVLGELHRSQEQLRAMKASRERLQEYRSALLQQYRFLAWYLQDLSDCLSRRGKERRSSFRVQVKVYANRARKDNGDRCVWFSGTEGRYYVLLCDGMGTGLGAVDEGQTASQMLRHLLCAGFPAEYALQSLNSICALRGSAGAVTVDLAEIRLDTGRTTLYKWGAAPSWLISEMGTEKIGTAGPPPGLSVTDTRQTVHRLSLGRGEMLVLLSDGAGGEDCLRGWGAVTEAGPGEIAARLLEHGSDTDDATVALVRLHHAPVVT